MFPGYQEYIRLRPAMLTHEPDQQCSSFGQMVYSSGVVETSDRRGQILDAVPPLAG